MPIPEPSSPDAATPIRADGLWRVRLLGGLEASSGDCVLQRFPGRPVATLLARLALLADRSHSREELIELLWPGLDLETGRKRLRQALSTLRGLLEPAGSDAGAVLVADRQTVRVHGDAIACDAVEFERALRAGRDDEAASLYRGELLPGFYDEWIEAERARLATLHGRLLERRSAGAGVDRLVAAEARADTPRAAAAAVGVATHRLPPYLSSFFGRDADLRRLAASIGAHRLTTITGTAGCGKTRIATEVARIGAGFEAVLFVALAACSEGARLGDHVRVAAGLPPSAGDPLVHVGAHLGPRRVLLVLDNFEQLVDAGGPLALAELLERLPTAHALVTSRRALRLAGEHEFALRPLSLPRAAESLALTMANPSVALFVDRARSVRADFQLTAANRADVVAVCRTLEGVPLALEIAATRIRTYSPAGMAAELLRGFGMVARRGAQAERAPRHASLHAAIAWSWGLLAPGRREFLAGLSVFRGGFSASEVGAVTGRADAHDLLDALVADSLLHAEADTTDGHLRFHMLQVVREFVAGHLDADAARVLRRAHRTCFLDRARALGDRHQPVAERELANFVEALDSALADDDASLAVSLGLALRLQWEWVGTPPEVLALLRRTAEVAPVDAPHRAALFGLLARLLLQAGHATEARECAARALATAADDPVDRADAQFASTWVEWVWTRDGARLLEPAREAVRLAAVAGSRETEARALLVVAAITLWHRHLASEAEALYVQAAGVFAEVGNPLGVLQTWHGRMACLQAMGRHDAAIRVALANEPRAEAMGHVEAQILFWNLLALSYEKTRRYADALDACRREARLAIRQHKVYNIAYALWNQCHYLARLRRPDEAALLIAFSQKYWVDQFGPLQAADERGVEKIRRLVCVQIGAARWQVLWRRGLGLPVHEGFALGCGDLP
jgi:predicted ATPase